MLKETISIQFVGSPFPAFPTIGLAVDLTNVIATTLVTDQFLREHEVERDEIPKLMGALLRDDDWTWEYSRDASLRAWELYGYRNILRSFPGHDEVRIDG